MHLFETKINKTPAWIIVRKDTRGVSVVHSISDSPTIKKYITNEVPNSKTEETLESKTEEISNSKTEETLRIKTDLPKKEKEKV